MHRLDLEDRGHPHVHRWWPRCACGWIGVQRRRRSDAERQYRQHVASLERRARRGRTPVEPRPVTPQDSLPPELR